MVLGPQGPGRVGRSQLILKLNRKNGPVVQLVRMPACHAGGRGFEPLPDRHFLFLLT